MIQWAVSSGVKRGDVMFLHGLESGPAGSKALAFADRWDADTPDLQTTEASRYLDECRATATAPCCNAPALVRAIEHSCNQVRPLLAQPRKLLIGSSWGGAVLARLAAEGSWRGPILMLATAARLLTNIRHLGPAQTALLIHGGEDDVVDCNDSRELAAESGSGATYWQVHDGHRLIESMNNGTVDLAIAWLLGMRA